MNAMLSLLNDEVDFARLLASPTSDALDEVEASAPGSDVGRTGHVSATGLGVLSALLPEVEGHPC